MKVRIQEDEPPRPCAIVLGHFVFGPVRCGQMTDMVEDETGEDFPVCSDHYMSDTGMKGYPQTP